MKTKILSFVLSAICATAFVFNVSENSVIRNPEANAVDLQAEKTVEDGEWSYIIGTDSVDIYKYLGRTVTRIQGRGLLSGDKDVLYCVISRLEIYQLKKLIDDKYSNTFITIINVENIYGEFVKSKTLKEKLDFNE